jgi:hypothetical protein
MAGAQRLPFVGIFLREFDAAFNIREEESDGAGGEIIQCFLLKHTPPPVSQSWLALQPSKL